ncbi:MAG: cupredoxin family copper-binding protein [Chloroflexota bacterium]
MTGRRHLRLVIPMTLGIFLLSAIGLSACYQAAPTTPVAPTPAPAPAGGTTTPPPAEQAPPSLQPIPQKPLAVQVNLSGFAFSPATITVPVGTPVIWTNKDSVTHTVTSNSGLFDSGNLARGATFSYTFKEKGTFQYHCNLHPSMTGKIIVVEGNAVPTGGTTTPPATGGTTTTPSAGGTTTPPPTTGATTPSATGGTTTPPATGGTTTPPTGGTTPPPPTGGTPPSGGSSDYNY